MHWRIHDHLSLLGAFKEITKDISCFAGLVNRVRLEAEDRPWFNPSLDSFFCLPLPSFASFAPCTFVHACSMVLCIIIYFVFLIIYIYLFFVLVVQFIFAPADTNFCPSGHKQDILFVVHWTPIENSVFLSLSRLDLPPRTPPADCSSPHLHPNSEAPVWL